MSSTKINLAKLEKAHWNDKDREQAALVINFVQLLMNDHDFDEILRLYKGLPYVQHNRNIGDNIEGVIKSIRELVKHAPEFSYDVKHVYVDGNHVILHSHVTLKAKHRGNDNQGFNIIDTWRIENGKLVEHWDAIQPINLSMRMYSLVTGGKVRNQNGVF